ncbi:sigma-54-dependent transcriptional regulator [Nitrococcus mobilis]|uniref:Two component, Sigma-54 specific, transcriptional regulator, Fis family protein n=1 Tax=Nitrococcus mobilis Nb-231 TaxID=314278 RepID=A4BNH3_9GAMM|nr:sigma-54 dependent transcriptional regulator [Nitrococcus mobilis]EAR22772.1 Two component, Sigma-54 specific, transcriptional regulator, Fis family protein [Nitrococcus mobilis Nb-231]
MPRPLALIVDDEPDIRELAQLTLEQMDLEVRTAPDLHTSRALLAAQPFSLCLTDMRLPDGDGLDLVRLMQKHHPDTPVAVITAHGSIETATAALKAGAFDFVTKPVDLHVLRRLVEHALRLSEFPEIDRRSRNTLLGDSSAMQQIRATIVKLARSQAPVYICGESGTGKELIARLIHDKGPRRDRAFVPVNCGAIPTELMESEFFGHKKGSFTGASADKPGLFQAADRGSLFLDEVAELPQHMQVKLLRAIQEKAVRPVGTLREESTDVRILSATHKDLGQLVTDGAFRRDLYYRINVIEVRAPSLRERTEDIPLLVEHTLRRMVGEANPLPRLDDAALAALSAYPFPGNVRELENILERALTLSENDLIGAADLQLPQKSREVQAPTTVEPAQDFELESYLGEVEREVIVKALEKSRYNKTAAAQLLGITFRALRYRLKKLGLE